MQIKQSISLISLMLVHPLSFLLIGASLSLFTVRSYNNEQLVSMRNKLFALLRAVVLALLFLGITPSAYFPIPIILAVSIATVAYIQTKKIKGDYQLFSGQNLPFDSFFLYFQPALSHYAEAVKKQQYLRRIVPR
ncbi:MAG: hypothetical protein CSB23_01500 [Deltaproteobacteria bacterium]|nr:MAG: hypothetical protein CSB23_01500 [Deltaproteobacteria bacterium]